MTTKERRRLAALQEAYGSRDFPADTAPQYLHQVGMGMFKAFRRFLGLPFTRAEFLELTDATAKAAADARRAEQARRAAVAAAHGGKVCQRCGGAGGHHSWPGWVCFECDGRGWV